MVQIFKIYLIPKNYLSVIADIGGLLGLFLGCSLLSLMEIFYFLFAAIIEKLRQKIRTENEELAKEQHEVVHVKEFNPNLYYAKDFKY